MLRYKLEISEMLLSFSCVGRVSLSLIRLLGYRVTALIMAIFNSHILLQESISTKAHVHLRELRPKLRCNGQVAVTLFNPDDRVYFQV